VRKQKTVLVLGAGASKEFGLPLGRDLKGLLAKDLNILFGDFGTQQTSGSYEIVEALKIISKDHNGRPGDINPHRVAAVRIAGAMGLSGSIDEYVERHKDDILCEQCAKLGISKAILQAERSSKLYLNPTKRHDDPLSGASECWLAYLLRDLTRGKSRADLASVFENIFVVNFNYDRCVEQFVYLWFQQIYNLSESESQIVSSKLRIFHPYGKIANLPFENSNDHIAFGGELDSRRLIKMANSIRTYSETVEEDANLEGYKREVGSADKIVFMGFGFHQQNMDLLSVPLGFERATARCYATIDGISEPRLELCKEQVSQTMGLISPDGLFFHSYRGNCEAFWSEYGEVVVQ
jgi:hypothetical protein